MQSDYEVTLNHQRATRTKDLAGGKTPAWATLNANIIATMHCYSRADQFRIEQTPGGPGSGPGVMTNLNTLFKFVPPFYDIRVNDQLVLAQDLYLGGIIVQNTGDIFKVLFVRQYVRTFQVDTEWIT